MYHGGFGNAGKTTRIGGQIEGRTDGGCTTSDTQGYCITDKFNLELVPKKINLNSKQFWVTTSPLYPQLILVLT